MAATHYTASFRNSCVIQPRDPNTKLPTTVLERESLDFAHSIGSTHGRAHRTQTYEQVLNSYEATASVIGRFKNEDASSGGRKKREERRRTKNGTIKQNSPPMEERDIISKDGTQLHHTSAVELKNLINDDDKFFAHLQALKAENKRTLKSLERLYDFTLEKTRNETIGGGVTTGERVTFGGTYVAEKASRLFDTTDGWRVQDKSRTSVKKKTKRRKNKLGDDLNKSIEACKNSLLLAGSGGSGDSGDRSDEYSTSEDQLQNADATINQVDDEDDVVDMSSEDENNDRKGQSQEVGKGESDAVDFSTEDEERLDKEQHHGFVDDEIYSLSDEDELDAKLKVKAPDSHVNILPDEYAPSFRGRSSSFDVIAHMWENFSVDEYAPYAACEKDKNKQRPWSPSITIPEPFQMTVRDEAKAKRKSKRIEKIEQDQLEKRLQEEMELQKRVRPTPVPPTTFLPLYNEITEQEEKRRKYVRDLSRKILKCTENPFSFTKREEVKKEMKKVRSMTDLRKQRKAEGEQKRFKANPYPDKLFNLTWADKLAEQDEYRKIKIKLRSEETLAKSSLPMNMKTRAGTTKYFTEGEKTKLMKKELRRRKQKSFRPDIHHDIPDFEVLHRKFENELEQRKTVNTPTVCEPFELQTEKIPQRRSKFVNNTTIKTEDSREEGRGRRTEQGRTGNRSRSLSWSRVSQQTPPVYSHTETSKLRHERLRQSLQKTKQEELQLSIKLNKKRKELTKLQKSVSKKAIAQDPARNRQKETKEKLKSFKEADHERRKEYQEYLEDMNVKLKDRPLLFEREAQTNARNKAHKRYEEILRDAGIAGDTLDSFLQGDVSESNGNEDVTSLDDDDGGDNDTDDNDGSFVEDSRHGNGGEYSDDGVTEDDNGSNDGSYVPGSNRTRSIYSDEEEDDDDNE